MPATASLTRWLTIPVVALSVAGLAACGTSDSATGVSASTATSASGGASPDANGEPAGMGAFHQCMSEHGVTRPARPEGAGGMPGGHGGPGRPGGPGGPGGPPGGAVGASAGAGASPGAGASAGAAGGPGGRQHDPTKAPPGVDQNTWTTARAACASLTPTPPAAPGN
jgi:hypothetical protein